MRARLRCQQCKSELRAADVVVASLQARCRHCGWSFGGQLAPYRRGALQEPRDNHADDAPSSRMVPRPATIEVIEATNTLAYRPTRANRAFVTVPFAALAAASIALATLAGSFDILAQLAAVLQLFVIIPFAVYALLAKQLNTHFIELAGADLRVRSRPFPIPFAAILVRRDVSQLYVTRDRVPRFVGQYAVYAKHADGSDAALIEGVSSPIEALYIEQEIERWLRLADVPVPGEYGPGRFLRTSDRPGPLTAHPTAGRSDRPPPRRSR